MYGSIPYWQWWRNVLFSKGAHMVYASALCGLILGKKDCFCFFWPNWKYTGWAFAHSLVQTASDRYVASKQDYVLAQEKTTVCKIPPHSCNTAIHSVSIHSCLLLVTSLHVYIHATVCTHVHVHAMVCTCTICVHTHTSLAWEDGTGIPWPD